MSGYLPEIKYETGFEEDKVVFQLKPLSRAAFIKILPGIDLAMSDQAGSSEQKMKVYESACEVLTTHIISMTGLRDGNGDSVDTTTLLDNIYFIQLVTKVFQKLIEDAGLGKE